MSQVEKPNLKRKSFTEPLAIVIEASFKNKELEFSIKREKFTFEVKSYENLNDPNLAIRSCRVKYNYSKVYNKCFPFNEGYFRRKIRKKSDFSKWQSKISRFF